METKLGKKTWLSIVIFSLVGQIAWTMENMFYNLYIVDEFNANASQIALMVSLSALTATITTLFMGALSDKLGKRKVFIIVGFLLWGLAILSFAFVNNKYISSASLGIALVILLDCLMTFFGSTANDAAFNAYLTEITNEKNRGKVEGVNSAMPLISILIVFGGLSSFAKPGTWPVVFILISSVVLISGVVGIFTIKEKKLEPKNEPYFKNIFYGFRPSIIKENKRLYIFLIAFAIFSTSLQVFMPFYIIYLQNAGLEIAFAKNIGFDSYVIIMAPAIIAAAIFTIFYGKVIDKYGFIKSVIPTLIIYVIGLILLTFFKTEIMMFLGCLLMMCGYLSATASFNAVIRKYTPLNKEGLFQGLRLVAQVLIPMLIGPWIGSMLCGGGALFGVAEEGFTVSPYIFLGAAIELVLIVIPLLFVRKEGVEKKYNSLATPEYDENNINPLNEYPNPLFQRDSYISLNGIWKMKISKDYSLDDIDNDILVPYCIESKASRINRRLEKNEFIIYKRNFSVDNEFIKDKTFINFLGVDQRFKIILNGREYDEIIALNLPVKIDVSDSIVNDNELIVIVKDELDFKYPLGKQSNNPKGIFYTPFSGIYFPVYLESVNKEYINDLKIKTSMDMVSLEIDSSANEFRIIIKDNDNIIHNEMYITKNINIKINNPILWDINNPHLYDLEIITANDKIKSYFGLREIKLENNLIYLNNKRVLLNGVLDQGYYPEGIITPSSYKSLENDVLFMKELGFNTLRKHIKLELPYFYYLCDKHGMLVLQDFINNGKYNFIIQTALPTIGLQKRNDKRMNKNKKQREMFIKAAEGLIDELESHPSIVGYTIFNEGWGQFDSENVYKHFKKKYPNLIFDTASGWYRGAKTDMPSYHWYFKNIDKLKSVEMPIFLSEFGALCYKVDGHCYGNDRVFGYRYFDSIEELENAYRSLFEEKIIPYKDNLIGTIYTQLSDVEDEDNGLYTYDRKILKMNKALIKEINGKLNE